MRDGETVNGKKEGRWVSYFANGNMQSEGEYRGGKKEGAWVLYWPNGNKNSEAHFRDGKYTGLYTAYHKNGKKEHEGRYNEFTGKSSADGTKDGEWLYYAEDGETVWRKITYRRGARTKPDEILGPRPGTAADNEK